MSGFAILDLLLGLVFIFFILSIISSAVVEVIMTKMNYRSKILTRWLLAIFDKEMMQPDGTRVKLGQAIADHCLTTALAKPGEATSFMDAKNFVSALIEKVTFDANNPSQVIQSLDDLLTAIEKATALNGTSLLSTELRRTILVFGSEAKMLANANVSNKDGDGTNPDPKNSFQLFREKLEAWFDSSMDRISGKLKKKYARPMTFWVGVAVTIGLNADAVAISKYLFDHKEEAAAFASGVQKAVDKVNKVGDSDSVAEVRVKVADQALKEIAPAGLPLGWDVDGKNVKDVQSFWKVAKSHAFGWLATVMAIMLGAPFWFDLLNKISNIRGSGSKPPSTTDKERDKKS